MFQIYKMQVLQKTKTCIIFALAKHGGYSSVG